MRAVWSFWSKPFQAHRQGIWPSERHHLLAWVLSVETARQHYPETQLYTDRAGAELLVEGLGLRFTQVSTALDALDGYDPDWWSLGKVYAYHLQTAPFVHLDSDVFLWKPLPTRLTQAAVFTQQPEPIPPGHSYYQPQQVEAALRGPPAGWLPAEWIWWRSRGGAQRGDCCGILGGNRVDFIHHYAGQALRLLDEPANQRALRQLDGKRLHMLLVEQYLLAACVEYHQRHAGSPFAAVTMEHLFHSPEEVYGVDALRRTGFTHLIGNMKRDARFARRLEMRVARDYPALYTRCLQTAR
jgi:hypothetical protein